MQILYGLFITLCGLFVGSFLNVCIYRIPRRKFFEQSRSYCPQCRTMLKWYENIPIFSYLFLKGRCRTCKEKIPVRYPLVEFTNMVAWLLAYLKFGISFYTALLLVLFSVLIVMSMIDYDIKEIPNSIIIVIMVLGVIGFFIDPKVTNILWWEKLIGLVAMSSLFLAIAIITRGGIGGGDIRILYSLGLFAGYKFVTLGTMIGVIIGAIAGLGLMFFRKTSRKAEMPLGPALSIGISIAILYGNDLINLYFNMF